ncbi:MAG TPA: nuclear transport factor 2 family protein [Candidatus Eisenbacteria bacterium]|nr:nuclear transport factor 2 family protein [Candidatus Eisenbacteria bacterium]
MSDEEALRLVVDRQAIRDLVHAYATAVDRRDWPRVRACFTPDAACDFSWFRGDLDTVLGHVERGLAQFETTMHLLGTHLADVAGDTATAETYAVCHHRLRREGGLADRVVGMRYLDALVRTPAGWRIRRRDVAVDWQRLDPVPPAP